MTSELVKETLTVRQDKTDLIEVSRHISEDGEMTIRFNNDITVVLPVFDELNQLIRLDPDSDIILDQLNIAYMFYLDEETRRIIDGSVPATIRETDNIDDSTTLLKLGEVDVEVEVEPWDLLSNLLANNPGKPDLELRLNDLLKAYINNDL